MFTAKLGKRPDLHLYGNEDEGVTHNKENKIVLRLLTAGASSQAGQALA